MAVETEAQKQGTAEIQGPFSLTERPSSQMLGSHFVGSSPSYPQGHLPRPPGLPETAGSTQPSLCDVQP